MLPRNLAWLILAADVIVRRTDCWLHVCTYNLRTYSTYLCMRVCIAQPETSHDDRAAALGAGMASFREAPDLPDLHPFWLLRINLGARARARPWGPGAQSQQNQRYHAVWPSPFSLPCQVMSMRSGRHRGAFLCRHQMYTKHFRTSMPSVRTNRDGHPSPTWPGSACTRFFRTNQKYNTTSNKSTLDAEAGPRIE